MKTLTIDTIMHPTAQPSAAQIKAAFALTVAVTEAVRQAGSVPSGTLYAIVSGQVTLAGYEAMLRQIVNAGLVSVDANHLVRWTGPQFGPSSTTRAAA